MAAQQPHPQKVIEGESKPQRNGTTVYIAITHRILKNAGIDPHNPETIPEELVLEYYNGGARDGEVAIDLKQSQSHE